MPTPRTRPDRVLTDAERARRARDNRAAYIAALERAVVDAAAEHAADHGLDWWAESYAPTIARARAAQTATKED